jgi:acyl transferase domain-containing protein
MGAELYGAFPVFREAFDGVCASLDRLLGCSLRDVVFGGDGLPAAGGVDGGCDGCLLDRTLFAQAGLFALEVALFALVRAWGVRPDFLLGHSIGEIVAAHVSGVFSLDDACALVAARGRLMGELPVGGAMVAVGAPEDVVAEELEGLQDRVALAGVNGPASVVISGDEPDVLGLARVFGERGFKTKRLNVSHAFHSPRMDGMLEEFQGIVEGLSFGEPRVPIVSNLTGGLASAGELCSPAYWVRHVRETVRFADGVRFLLGEGVNGFLELGPDGVLSTMTAENAAAEPRASVGVPVLRRDRPEAFSLLQGLSEMWVSGATEVDWARVFDDSGAQAARLPTYAFQRERYWLESTVPSGDPAAIGLAQAEHPLLGACVELAHGNGWLFTGRLSLSAHPWLADHQVNGTAILPGTAFLELALHAGEQTGCGFVQELTLHAPLALTDHEAVQLQITVAEPDEREERSIAIHSRPEDRQDASLDLDDWTLNATGTLTQTTAPEGPPAHSPRRAPLIPRMRWRARSRA